LGNYMGNYVGQIWGNQDSSAKTAVNPSASSTEIPSKPMKPMQSSDFSADSNVLPFANSQKASAKQPRIPHRLHDPVSKAKTPKVDSRNERLQLKKPRSCIAKVCCIPQSRTGKIVCGVSIVAILGAIALFLGLFWPRIPQFDVISVIPLTSTYFIYRYPNDTIALTMTLNLNVSIRNDNFYKIAVDKVGTNVSFFYYLIFRHF